MTAVNGFFSYYTIGCARISNWRRQTKSNTANSVGINIHSVISHKSQAETYGLKPKWWEMRYDLSTLNTPVYIASLYVYNASNLGDLAL